MALRNARPEGLTSGLSLSSSSMDNAADKDAHKLSESLIGLRLLFVVISKSVDS